MYWRWLKGFTAVLTLLVFGAKRANDRSWHTFLVGITDFDTRWLYTSRVDTRTMEEAPHDLPEGLTHVIVMGHAMDFDLVQTYPSALAGAATGREYSHEAGIVIQLARQVAAQLMAHDGLGAHARDELGLSETASARPVKASDLGSNVFSRGRPSAGGRCHLARFT